MYFHKINLLRIKNIISSKNKELSSKIKWIHINKEINISNNSNMIYLLIIYLVD